MKTSIPCECDAPAHEQQLRSLWPSRRERGHLKGECVNSATWRVANGKNLCIDCKAEIYFLETIVGIARPPQRYE